MSEQIKSLFCIEGVEEPCKNPIFYDFGDERLITLKILTYLKAYLPKIMLLYKDAEDKFIKIDPDDIGVGVRKEFGDYIVVLIPSDDNSTYPDESFTRENTEYAFQIQLRVIHDIPEACVENMMLFKSGIKSMLATMYENIGLNISIEPFNWDGTFSIDDINRSVSEGTYTFSVFDFKQKKDFQITI